MGLRGTAETLRHDAADDDIASGLFLRLMEYTLEKDEKLASIAKGIPKNAKYTSKDIQNEIIETLADMVLGEIFSAPVLTKPDPSRQVIVEVDASDTGVGTVHRLLVQ